MKHWHLIIISFLLFSPFISSVVTADESIVLVVEISGTINQATVELVSESMTVADQENAEAIIFTLDTPGGGLEQTFDIADRIQQSNIPVIGFVYPKGATAWSAGTFILLSTPLAAMADNTVIGSCQPVEITAEGTKKINDSKTINALVSWIQERARMYNRNTSLAADFIKKNTNVNASRAKKAGVIEVTASSVKSLLTSIDGMNVTTAAGNQTLFTANSSIEWYTPSFRVQFFRFISNPILTSLLFMMGVFALIFGISAPGYGAEIFGGIAILLSLIGSGFAISELSIIFLIIGGILLLVEIFVIPGFGVVGLGGIISLAIGSIFLIPTYASRNWVITMDWVNDLIMVILAAVVLLSVFFVFLLYKIIEIRSKKKAVGVFAGEKAITLDRLSPEKKGYIRFRGELWQATADTIIEKDEPVRIINKEGSLLKVEPFRKTTKH
ncbi:MAG: nodulation protein NfeD [Thermoplasmatota archaeon]